MTRMKGFTLIEILVALTIFAILAAMSASSLYNAFTTKEKLSKTTDKLTEIQLALNIMERDLLQVIKRPIYGNEMHQFSFFIGEPSYLEFTKTGLVNPQMLAKRAKMERIALVCNQGKLFRRRWNVLDTPNRKNYQDKLLLANLKHCEFKYYDPNLQQLSNWQGSELTRNQQNFAFPKAVQFKFNIEGLGQMTYLFIIPVGLYA